MVIFLWGFFLLIVTLGYAKVQDRTYLSKCSCHDDRSRPYCDFSTLSKKKLLALSNKLLSFQIICVKVGDGDHVYLPTFTTLLLPLDRVIQPGPLGEIDLNGMLPPHYSSSDDIHSSKQVATASTTATTSIPSPELMGLTWRSGSFHFLFPSLLFVQNLLKSPVAMAHTKDLNQYVLSLDKEHIACRVDEGCMSAENLFNQSNSASITWIQEEITVQIGRFLALSNNSHLSYRVEGWGQIWKAGEGKEAQVNPASQFTGVYYLSAAKEILGSTASAGGCLRLIDPRLAAAVIQPKGVRNLYGESFEICPPPEGGLLVIFPSFVMHEFKTLPHQYSHPIVSLLFDVFLS
eukprot:gene9836-10879_t